ncbi:tetratricopeptide repeat protein [Nocardia sp. NPDC055321]
MNRFGRRRESDNDPVAEGSTVHAQGPGSVAIGPDSVVGSVIAGGARVTTLPAEALLPMAQLDAPPGIDNLPAVSAHFVGRDRELDRLDTALADTARVVVQAVHGLGGIGKTTLVAQWARTRAHGHIPKWWINADKPAVLQQELASFAAALQPTLAQWLTTEQLADRALQWLATHSGWLLILDNVEDPADIDPVLARAQGGRIVLTSRLSTGWAHIGAEVVSMDVLAPAESLALLTNIITGNRTPPRALDGAAALCRELGHLPLAVEQAGAYLEQTALTPTQYLDQLATYPAQIYRHGGARTRAERTIARIWRVTMDRITATHPEAAEILRVMAWYAPDGIPVGLLDGIADPPALHAALGALTAYSMITLDPDTATVSVHRLVQAVARTADLDDPRRGLAEIERAHVRASTTLQSALPADERDPRTWPTWRILLPHIDSLATRTEHDTLVTVGTLRKTALFLLNQGAHGRAIDYTVRAVTGYERVLGIDHPDTLTSRNDLAGAYESAGRASEAVPLHERALTDCERVLGIDHPDTLTSRNDLALAYRSVGRANEAIALYERALTDSERVLGIDHPDTLTSRNNLAIAYESAGRTSEAVPLLEQALTDCERVLGIDHPDTLYSRNNLASVYESAGRTSEAVPLLERTLTDRERVLGIDHPDTLYSRNNLAIAYESAGRTSEAVPLFERALTDRERVLGIDHPNTLTSRNNLAIAYESAGRTSEAIPLHERNLTGYECVLGIDHPNTLTSRNNLALAYKSVGRTSEAIALFERTLTDRERVLGIDHPNTLTSRNNLALAYKSVGRTSEAVPLLERTLTDRERVLGIDHPATRISRENLARLRNLQKGL